MFDKYFTLVLFALIYVINCDDVAVTRDTNNGQVIGRRINYDNCSVDTFLGIPYAEPPLYDLRFRKPEPVSNWTTPYEAIQYPNPCYQISSGANYLNTNFSEDCLYLNIWQPSCNNCSSLKAVMFWIHGGALIGGSSSQSMFQGQVLAYKGDVVVVSINYRVNTFGFFYTGTNDVSGNVGLWDCVLALQWVKDNIENFCGDPNKITIFGQSGGGWAVSILLLSPVSRNLFNNAVIMSGALVSGSIATKKIAKQNWLLGAQAIGCANGAATHFNEEIVSCMRYNATPSALASIIFLPQVLRNRAGVVEMVVIDCDFLPDSPVAMIECGNYRKDVNIIVSTVSDEGSPNLAFVNSTEFSPTNPYNLTYDEARETLIQYTSRVNSYTNLSFSPVPDIYFDNISPNSTDYDLIRRTIGFGFGDLLLGCPTYAFARLMFENNKCKHNTTNVYQYIYNSRLGVQNFYSCGAWMGSCHGADIIPLFGLPYINYNTSNDAQREESDQVIGFYTHFARFGQPAPQNGVEWKKWYRLRGEIIEPYFQLNNTLDANYSFFSHGLKITECEYLWKKYFVVKIPNNC